MSRTFSHEGEVVTLTAPTGGVTAGTPVLITNLLVIPRTTAAEAASFDGDVCGVHTGVPKATGATWAEGQNLYWDDTAKKFTPTATNNYYAGVAMAAAASGDATGTIRLNGISIKAAG